MSATLIAQNPIPATAAAAEQLWLDVLAGKEPPVGPPNPTLRTPELRQAAQLRAYFAQSDAQELASPLPMATQIRLMQRLREQGAFKPPAPTLVRQLKALLEWLLPSGSSVGPGYALVAGVVMAAVVVPALVGQMGGNVLGQSDADDPAIPKGQPGIPKSLPSTQPGIGNTETAPVLLVLSADPAEQAATLQRTLQQAGASVTLQPGPGGEWQLVAQVPEAVRFAVAQAMQPWGLGQIPATLVINVQPAAR